MPMTAAAGSSLSYFREAIPLFPGVDGVVPWACSTSAPPGRLLYAPPLHARHPAAAPMAV